MSLEGHVRDQMSLGTVTGGDAAFRELAKDCVCFANAQGGQIAIGIQDSEAEPPAGLTVSTELLDRVRKRIGELTVNVSAAVERMEPSNGGQFILVTISRSLQPASTTDGRYFLRVSDDCKPLVGADIQRLLDERNAQPWESLTNYSRDSRTARFPDRLRAGRNSGTEGHRGRWKLDWPFD